MSLADDVGFRSGYVPKGRAGPIMESLGAVGMWSGYANSVRRIEKAGKAMSEDGNASLLHRAVSKVAGAMSRKRNGELFKRAFSSRDGNPEVRSLYFRFAKVLEDGSVLAEWRTVRNGKDFLAWVMEDDGRAGVFREAVMLADEIDPETLSHEILEGYGEAIRKRKAPKGLGKAAFARQSAKQLHGFYRKMGMQALKEELKGEANPKPNPNGEVDRKISEWVDENSEMLFSKAGDPAKGVESGMVADARNAIGTIRTYANRDSVGHHGFCEFSGRILDICGFILGNAKDMANAWEKGGTSRYVYAGCILSAFIPAVRMCSSCRLVPKKGTQRLPDGSLVGGLRKNENSEWVVRSEFRRDGTADVFRKAASDAHGIMKAGNGKLFSDGVFGARIVDAVRPVLMLACEFSSADYSLFFDVVHGLEYVDVENAPKASNGDSFMAVGKFNENAPKALEAMEAGEIRALDRIRRKGVSRMSAVNPMSKTPGGAEITSIYDQFQGNYL